MCRVHKPRVPNGPASPQTRPSRWHGDSTSLGRPRYMTTGRGHDLAYDWRLWPRGLIGTPTGRPGRGGTVIQLRPSSPTGDVLDLFTPLFPDRHGRGRLGTTDRELPLGVGPGSRWSRQGKAHKSTAIPRTVPCHALRTYRTVLSGHVRRTLYSLPDGAEHKQYRGRLRLPSHANTVQPGRS